MHCMKHIRNVCSRRKHEYGKRKNIVIGEGIPKICVPIVGKTKEELLSEVEVLKSVPVDVVEWRMDWFEEVECCEKAVAMLQVLREAMPEMPILATFRSKKEGGELEISTAAYVELNKAIIDSGNADLIDVELFTGEAQVKELIAHAHDKGVRVIMSNHDFDKTPSYNEILTRLKAMQTLGADIPKIAVMPTCKADVITLLQATNDMHETLRIVRSSQCQWRVQAYYPDCVERSLVLH